MNTTNYRAFFSRRAAAFAAGRIGLALPLLAAAVAGSLGQRAWGGDLFPDAENVFPFVDRIDNDVLAGQSTAWFGYENVGETTVIGVVEGSYNWFEPTLGDERVIRGQILIFPAGMHHNVFSVDFADPADEMRWHILSANDTDHTAYATVYEGKNLKSPPTYSAAVVTDYIRPTSLGGQTLSIYNYPTDHATMPIHSPNVVVEDGAAFNLQGPFQTSNGSAMQRLRARNGGIVNLVGGTLAIEQAPGADGAGTGILTVDDGGELRIVGGALDILRLDVKPGGLLFVTTPTLDVGSSIMQQDGEAVFANTTIDGAVHVGAGSATNIVGDVHFNTLVFGPGDFFGSGTAHFDGGYSPGASPAVVEHENSIAFGSGNMLTIELAGTALGEFDRLVTEADAMLDGTLNVQLIDGFTLAANQTFEFLNVAGTRTGQFIGLGQDDFVGNFSGIDLFINYAAGDGNDVALYTAVPEPMSGALLMLGVGLIALRRRDSDTRKRALPIGTVRNGGDLAVWNADLRRHHRRRRQWIAIVTHR